MLGLFFDMLFMGVCTTRHWRTSGRLAQELNVCTVCCHKWFDYEDKGVGFEVCKNLKMTRNLQINPIILIPFVQESTHGLTNENNYSYKREYIFAEKPNKESKSQSNISQNITCFIKISPYFSHLNFRDE